MKMHLYMMAFLSVALIGALQGCSAAGCAEGSGGAGGEASACRQYGIIDYTVAGVGGTSNVGSSISSTGLSSSSSATTSSSGNGLGNSSSSSGGISSSGGL